MTLPPWSRTIPWIGLVAAGTWFARQLFDSRSLQHALQAAHAAHAAHAASPTIKPTTAEVPSPKAAPPSPQLSRSGPSVAPADLLAQCKSRIRALVAHELAGLGSIHPDVIEKALSPLSPAEWAALAAGDPAFAFASQYNQRDVPEDERIEAILRWRAYTKLAAVDPAAALRLTERGTVKDTSGELINLITSSLQRWAKDDPASAVRWGKAQADRLPLGINHAHMALEALARDDMAGAWAMARNEGIDVTQAMAYLSRATASPADCDAFMTEIAALQANAPHGFVGGANQYYEDMAVKLAHSASFDEARSFLEKWAAPLEWRDQAALAAVKTSLSRTPDPRSGAAADWLVAFAPETRRHQAVENLVSAWADEDFAQPAAWLQRHADTPWHDTGLAALCQKVAPFDPEAAAEWARAINDPDLRKKALAAPPSVH